MIGDKLNEDLKSITLTHQLNKPLQSVHRKLVDSISTNSMKDVGTKMAFSLLKQMH